MSSRTSGTAQHADTAAAAAADAERQPLLGNKPASAGSSVLSAAWWRRRMTADVRRDWADLVLLFCYVITGLLDSSSISIWGSFVSMQTGNTVYVGLGLAAPAESTRWIKSGVSIASFCVGSFFFSRFHRLFSPKRRWVLCASFLAQGLLTVAAAVIVVLSAPPPPPPPSSSSSPMTTTTTTRITDERLGWQVLAPIALVAFQSCGQAVASRALGYNALTSVVLTSIYCDLFSDPLLLAARNVERNRRAAAPLLVLLGAFLGGLLARSSVGIAGALWTAAVLKLLIVLSWLAWPAAAEEPAPESD